MWNYLRMRREDLGYVYGRTEVSLPEDYVLDATSLVSHPFCVISK